jgi:ribonuclease HII
MHTPAPYAPVLFRYTKRVRSMAKLFQIPPVQGVTKATAKQQMLKSLICSDAPEEALRYRGIQLIAGVDEVGRGALFGPVVAAAVILPRKNAILMRMGLKDSKQLTREEREKLDRRIRKTALAIGIAEIDAETIDRINIYHATRLAMLRAVEALGLTPEHILIDAMLIDHPCSQTKLFYGDALCLSIAAASVIAKVHRDGLLRTLDKQYPQYGLAQHKGYATPEHRAALAQHGPTPLHRRSFNFVAESDPDALLEATLSEADLYLDDPETLIDIDASIPVISTEGAAVAERSAVQTSERPHPEAETPTQDTTAA